jgi:hypothetical protein
MSKYLALISLIALRIIYNPSYSEAKKQPGYGTPGFGTSLAQPVRLASFNEKDGLRFYEKLGNQKSIIRIKMEDKKSETWFFPVHEISLAAKKS